MRCFIIFLLLGFASQTHAQQSVTRLVTMNWQGGSQIAEGFGAARVNVSYAFVICYGEIHIAYESEPSTFTVTDTRYWLDGKSYDMSSLSPSMPSVITFAGSVTQADGRTIGNFSDASTVSSQGVGCYGQTQEIGKLGDYFPNVGSRTNAAVSQFLNSLSLRVNRMSTLRSAAARDRIRSQEREAERARAQAEAQRQAENQARQERAASDQQTQADAERRARQAEYDRQARNRQLEAERTEALAQSVTTAADMIGQAIVRAAEEDRAREEARRLREEREQMERIERENQRLREVRQNRQNLINLLNQSANATTSAVETTNDRRRLILSEIGELKQYRNRPEKRYAVIVATRPLERYVIPVPSRLVDPYAFDEYNSNNHSQVYARQKSQIDALTAAHVNTEMVVTRPFEMVRNADGFYPMNQDVIASFTRTNPHFTNVHILGWYDEAGAQEIYNKVSQRVRSCECKLTLQRAIHQP